MRVAIVHDWLYGGGAEKVVEQLHLIYPDAPIYTSYCTPEWRERLDNKVITGYLQWWPFAKARKFLPLLRQWWFARLNLDDFDLIISTTGNGEAKFIQAPPGAKHVCYCHTPPHFYWRKYESYLANPGFGGLDWLAKIGLRVLVKPLRLRDFQAARKVDYFIANSTHIQADIKKFYGVDSKVIFPPVSVGEFDGPDKKPAKNKPFIYWGRHVPDKRIDLAIEACNQLKYPLTIVGEGAETVRLKKLAGPTIKFVGRVSDKELHKLASGAKGFIFPSEEDFGIAPVEALASGLPVIAYKAGGALDYVIDGKTGVFFTKQTIESLTDALKSFKPEKFKTTDLQNSAKKFSNDKFKSEIKKFMAGVR